MSFPAGEKYEDVVGSGSFLVSQQRIQSSRGSSTPAAARDNGSRESDTSTNAHASCRPVASASKEKARLVRPEEAGPHNSTSAPRGKPPPSTASSSLTPLGWTSRMARFGSPSRPRPMRAVSNFTCWRERPGIFVDSLFIRLQVDLIPMGSVVKADR